MSMKTWIEISKKNLLTNALYLKRFLKSGTRFMAVVKANAYGHGLCETAHILASNKQTAKNLWFGVDSVGEGITLRKEGIKQPILVLGFTPRNNLADAVRYNLRLTIYNHEIIRALAKICTITKPCIVHTKVETGTTRQGVERSELVHFAKTILETPGIILEGISTHFANVEDTTNSVYAEQQLTNFEHALRDLQTAKIQIPIQHTAASAATLLFPHTHFNLVRAGIALYGLWPSPITRALIQQNKKLHAGGLHPTLTWKSLIAQTKHVKKGTPVSYGLTERVSRASRVAIIPIGYYDGFDRGLSSVGSVLIHGRRAKVLGRVCMNMIIVDITDIPNARIEDEVVLVGTQNKEQITAEEIASKIDTINYEVISRINPLIQRVVV